MADQLTTTSNTGSQGSTDTPQSAGGTATGAPTGLVQPGGTASSLLSNQGGVPLRSTALSTVNLAPGKTGTTTGTSVVATSPAKKHHVNAPLFGVSIAFIIVSIVLFWTTSRSAKSTT